MAPYLTVVLPHTISLCLISNKFEEGSEEFEAIADRNKMDILLYKYVETLFEAQKDIVDSFQQASDDLAAEMESVEAELNDSLPQVDAEVAAEMALLPPGSAMPVDIPPKIDMHLANVGDEPQNHDTPFFWHVPKSGGTTLQRLYWCMGSTVANEVGANPKFGNPTKRRGLVSFNPWDSNPGKVINVDVSTKDGILEAKNRGFLGNNVVKDPDHPHVDFVSTPEFQFAAGMLFTPFYKARMFALFRHRELASERCDFIRTFLTISCVPFHQLKSRREGSVKVLLPAKGHVGAHIQSQVGQDVCG